MIRCILIILLCFIFYSCSESTPSEIIKPKKMQRILWDITRADALARQLIKNDSGKILANESIRLIKEVFIINNVDQKQFEKSYSYYTHHPDIMRIMFDSISLQQTRKSSLDTNNNRRFFDKKFN